MSYISNPVLFNYINLETVTGLTVLATNPYLPAKRKLTVNDIVQTDKSKVSSAFYNERPITVTVGITRSTRGLLETSLDALMTILQGIEKDLILPQAGGTRKYIATFQDSIIKSSGGSYLELDLVFNCSDHFGYEPNYALALALAGNTSYSRTDAMTFAGSAPWQVPIITITYTAITGLTGRTITIGNPVTNQFVVINRTWVVGEVLTIDSYAKTVQVNGVDIEYTGAIPEWAPQAGWWSYTDSFTTRTFNARIIYYKRYI